MAVHQLADARRLGRHVPGRAGVDVPREEVERHVVVVGVGEELVGPFLVSGEGGAADLEVGEFALEVLRHNLEELEELGRGTAPAARGEVLRGVVERIEVGFVPDFPVNDVELVREGDVAGGAGGVHAPAPALVVVADHVFADAGPLGEVLRGQHAVLLGAVLDGLAEAEEHGGAGAADGVEVVVGEHEVVVLRVVLVRVEVREDGVDVAGVGAARDAVDGVVRAREGEAGGLVVEEVAALLVAAHGRHGGAVVDGVHRLDRAERLRGVDGDVGGGRRLGGEHRTCGEAGREENDSFHFIFLSGRWASIADYPCGCKA